MKKIKLLIYEYCTYIGGFWRCIKNHTYVSCLIAAIIVSLLCYEFSKNYMSKYSFTTASEAVDSYSKFLHELKDTKETDAMHFSDFIKDWQELSDTIFSFAANDSTFNSHMGLVSCIYLTHDSIRQELIRLSDTFKPTCEEVIDIKIETNPYRYDRKLKLLAKEADTFYSSLDTASVYVDDAMGVVLRYRRFLNSVESVGVNSKTDLLNFLKLEDKLFRTYLMHLYEYNDFSLADISKKTDKVCNHVAQTIDGKVDADETIVYLKKRTTRRLLQNSERCLCDIRQKRINTSELASSYLWMVVQPCIYIDSFGLALMTDDERKSLISIAREIPKLDKHVAKLQTTSELLNDELPNQILKCYVASLCP